MINLIFLLSILCTIFSFAFSEFVVGDILQIAAQVLVGLLFLISVFKFFYRHLFKPPQILNTWFYCLVVLLLFLFIFPDYAKENLLSSIRELFIPFAITFSAYVLLNITKKQFLFGILTIAVVSIFASLYTVVNSGGFVIESIYREGVAKNQTAPFYSIIGLVCLFQMIKNHNLVIKLVLFIAFVCCCMYCIVLRARAATLGLLLVSIMIFWRCYKNKLVFIVPIVACIAFFFLAEQIEFLFETSFVGDTDQTDLNSLSSGRVERNEDSLSFFLSHPIEGAVEGDSLSMVIWSDYPVPHLYILWKVVQFGLFWGAPFLIIYAMLCNDAVKLFLKDNDLLVLSGICLILAIFISLAEYSAPFGPGTSFILCYMLFGYALKIQQKHK